MTCCCGGELMAQELLIQHHLKRLRLPTILNHHQKLATDAAQQNLSYGAYLLRLLELEVAQREENQQKRRIAQARFPYLKALDQFNFSAIPSVNQARVLELARGEYLVQKENLVLVGNMGTGKTHCAIALGLLACGLSAREAGAVHYR